jgi:hypothetical protein
MRASSEKYDSRMRSSRCVCTPMHSRTPHSLYLCFPAPLHSFAKANQNVFSSRDLLRLRSQLESRRNATLESIVNREIDLFVCFNLPYSFCACGVCAFVRVLWLNRKDFNGSYSVMHTQMLRQNCARQDINFINI